MRKGIVWIIVIVLVIIATFTITSGKKHVEAPTSNSTSKEKIKVGIIIPVSGQVADIGEEIANTINYTGTKVSNIEFVIEDDQCLPKNAISAYNKLKQEGVKIFSVACSGSTLALAPLAKEDGNLILTAYSGSIDVRETGDEVIRFVPDGLQIANKMTDLIKKNPDWKVGILYAQQDYASSVAKELEDKVSDQITISQGYSLDETTFKTHLLKYKDSDVNILAIIPLPDDKTAQIIYKEIQDLNISLPVLGEANMCDMATQPSDYGLHGTCLKAELDTPGYHAFIEEFEEVTGGAVQHYPFFNSILYDIFAKLDLIIQKENISNIDNKTISNIKKDFLKGFEGEVANYKFTPTGEVKDADYFIEVEF